MLEISKEESQIIREKVEGVHIIKTMRQHSTRGKRYVEPIDKVIDILAELRGVDVKTLID